MRTEQARRILEENNGEAFREGCGTVPDRLIDLVKAIEEVAKEGDQLYKGRRDHVVCEPWLQQAPPATGGRRISKNMARKIRQKKQKERDRVEDLERNKDGMGSDEGRGSEG